MRYHEILEDLGEHRRLLFHTTTSTSLAMILGTNRIDTRTTDAARGAGSPRGISLTRSYDFARSFKGKRGFILVLDASLISTKPVAYWSHDQRKEFNRADEMEEFAAKPIEPLSRYLVSINAPRGFDEWVRSVSELRDEKDFVPHFLGGRLPAFQAEIDNGFADWSRFWNVWQPVRGIDRAA